MKKKTIKAYALVHKETPHKIENEAYFESSGGCCCYSDPKSLAVYESEEDALSNVRFYPYYKVVPCTITYSLPAKSK